MKKILIKNKQGIQTHGAEMEEPTQWIADCVANNYWGLPEQDELDEEGKPTGNKIPAEYTIEIIDITNEHALQECIQKRKMEYPTAEEFMNAYFDGDEEALQALQAKRLAIKAKYPKPNKE
jgi:hypothetical protein